jgi:hypothetical protein
MGTNTDARQPVMRLQPAYVVSGAVCVGHLKPGQIMQTDGKRQGPMILSIKSTDAGIGRDYLILERPELLLTADGGPLPLLDALLVRLFAFLRQIPPAQSRRSTDEAPFIDDRPFDHLHQASRHSAPHSSSAHHAAHSAAIGVDGIGG